MKVAHILYSGLGGHSAVLFSLLESGFLRNETNHVIFAGVEDPPVDYLIKCEKLEINYTFVRKEQGKNHFIFLVVILKNLIKLNIDALFIHGLSIVFIIPILKLIFIRKNFYVLVRDTQANKLKSRKEWILLAFSNVFANNIVYLTKQATYLPLKKLTWFYRTNKSVIIGNGLDVSYYSPSNIKDDNNNIFNIGMQSRMQANKDHNTLIRSFELLCRRSQNNNFHLHLAGDGETRGEIEKLVNSLNLNLKVTFYGFLNNNEILAFLQKLDLYVHCTYGETMSTSIMQALSCGLPVIASNVDGVNNMISGDIGLLYEPGNICDLTNKIETLISCTEKLNKMSLAARDFAVINFTITDKVKVYEALFYGIKI